LLAAQLGAGGLGRVGLDQTISVARDPHQLFARGDALGTSRSPSSRIRVMPAQRGADLGFGRRLWICARMASSVTSSSNTPVRPW
jgi:hypothetical protein